MLWFSTEIIKWVEREREREREFHNGRFLRWSESWFLMSTVISPLRESFWVSHVMNFLRHPFGYLNIWVDIGLIKCTYGRCVNSFKLGTTIWVHSRAWERYGGLMSPFYHGTTGIISWLWVCTKEAAVPGEQWVSLHLLLYLWAYICHWACWR